MERPEVLQLGPGRSALAVSLGGEDEAAGAVELLGFEGPRPTLVVTNAISNARATTTTAIRAARRRPIESSFPTACTPSPRSAPLSAATFSEWAETRPLRVTALA